MIYYVPKLHKRLEKPPGRLIISGINSLFSQLGEYLDHYLKALVQKRRSYLRDNTQLITELQNITDSGNCLLITIDVNSLYTSIIHKGGLEGVEKALHENTELKQEQIGFILEGLQLAMESNYFWYKKSYFVQTKGVAMGAILFMNMWEEKYIYEKRIPQIKLYWRYIDDLIILWEGTVESFEKFLKEINHNEYGISFTGEWDYQQIDYLDLQVFKNGNELYTKTFFKSTDRNGYIPMSSCHPPKWKGNIPKGQLLRLRRKCRTLEDLDAQADTLIKTFEEKGYPKKNLVNLINLINLK